MWLPWAPAKDEEAGLRLGRLKPGQGRRQPRVKLWWVGAMRRAKAATVMRRQPRTTAKGGGAVRRASGARLYGRRSVVKASFRRNRRNRGNGGWVRHARYLAREGAQREAERGRGFTAVFDSVDMAAVVREWECAGDQLMWSFILSPEDAERIDLRQHVREFAAGMERDVGTSLEWVAIDHHNTDDAHVHVLIRGVRDDGRVLTLDRDYVRRGLRELSQEIIERELGPRTEREVLLARGRTIEREQWTEIDRALERRAGVDRVVSYDNFQPYTEGARVRAEQEMERLAYLERLGLARRIDERAWELSPEHEPELRRRQREHDIIKSRARERQHERQERDRDTEREVER
jgi:type IV secretory pathway VirD2 relaxase